MRSRARAACAALVVAGTCGILGVTSPALAQRSHPQVGRAGSLPPSPSPLTTPYPGATVTVDPRWYGVQPFVQQPFQQHRRRQGVVPRSGSYYPQSASYVPYYPQYYGVNDVNGVPLASYFSSPPAPSAPMAPASVPDLRGSPYVVGEGGAMLVEFGRGDRRTVPACAAMAAAQTPDGEPRTVFYTPPADGVILHAGARGRVLGTPGAGAQVCYAVDEYGRMVLDY